MIDTRGYRGGAGITVHPPAEQAVIHEAMVKAAGASIRAALSGDLSTPGPIGQPIGVGGGDA